MDRIELYQRRASRWVAVSVILMIAGVGIGIFGVLKLPGLAMGDPAVEWGEVVGILCLGTGVILASMKAALVASWWDAQHLSERVHQEREKPSP